MLVFLVSARIICPAVPRRYSIFWKRRDLTGRIG
jgi:hypothetical protein